MEETITKRELLVIFIATYNEYARNAEFFAVLCHTDEVNRYITKRSAIQSIIDEFFDEDIDYQFIKVADNAFGISFSWKKAVIIDE